VTRVVMESTSSYWKGAYYLLEADGFECWLVNAREVKNVPGRPKTDIKRDARRLARLHRGWELVAIAVPTAEQEAVRDLCRARAALVRGRGSGPAATG
jgi:transposase